MAVIATKNTDREFNPPGFIKVSPAALKLARDFSETIKFTQKGDWVVIFHWAHSISVRPEPNAPLQDIGACLMLGASERNEIPSNVSQTGGGVEFAVEIPKEIWEKSIQRLIDIDEKQFFKLALR
jgi:hypothetical protein